MRRKNRRIGCPPDSVNLAMRFKMKGKQEQSNTTTRIQCHEINFQNKLNLILIFRPIIKGFIRVNETNSFILKIYFVTLDSRRRIALFLFTFHDTDCWVGVTIEVSSENKDVALKFLHPHVWCQHQIF